MEAQSKNMLITPSADGVSSFYFLRCKVLKVLASCKENFKFLIEVPGQNMTLHRLCIFFNVPKEVTLKIRAIHRKKYVSNSSSITVV
jgi:hypothetical protein